MKNIEHENKLRALVLKELAQKIGRNVSDADPNMSLVDLGLSSMDLVEVILSVDETMPSAKELYELSFDDFETINKIVETFSG